MLRGLALLCAGLCLAFAADAAQTLRVLAWPGYADRDLLVAFEKRHGASVEVVEISTGDEQWQRATASPANAFDVIALDVAELQRYVEQGQLLPLNLRNIPNTRGQHERFRNLAAIPGLTQAGQVYGVPYTYVEMGLIYNRRLLRAAPTSIDALWDPHYRGKVLVYAGGALSFSVAAQALGIADPFRLDADQFARTLQKLRELRENVLDFYRRPEDAVTLFREREVALVYARYGRQQLRQLERAGADVGYVVPREGALTRLDCWAVLRTAHDTALAEAFINHMLSPAVSRQLPVRHGLPDAHVLPRFANGDRWLAPVEDYGKRRLFWERILAGHRPEP